MACNSLSLLPASSPTSSLPSISNSDTYTPFTTSRGPRLRWITPQRRRPDSFSSNFVKFRASFARQPIGEDNNEDSASAAKFAENTSIADFVRFKRGGRGSRELQTAVVCYGKKFPWSLLWPFLQVDLVSTIHIADKEYFSTIQKELELYDCVLYEMVASKESLENKRNPNSETNLKSSRNRGFNILGCIQRQMARILMLDFQLDCLDYQSENWCHADLDFETFKLLQVLLSQREKGESFFTFARDMTLRSTKAMIQPALVPEDLGPWRSKLLWASRVLPMPLVGLLIIGTICADAGSSTSEYPELEALSRLDLASAMKVFLARRLTSEFTQVTADVEEKSVIIGERNRAAIAALRRAIENGNRRIAILYGGGHMPDLGRQLREEFELIPTRVQWITAWSIKNRDMKLSQIPLLRKMAEVSGWPLNRYQTLALLIFSSVLAIDLWFWELFFGTAVDWISQVVGALFRDGRGLDFSGCNREFLCILMIFTCD